MIGLLLLIRSYYPGGLSSSSLVFWLDARYAESYNKTGSVWKDMSGNDYHATINPGVTYSSFNGGAFYFKGGVDVIIPAIVDTFPITAITSVTHDGNWVLIGSESTNQIISLTLDGRRITMSVHCVHWGEGITVMYGGTNHHRSTTLPTRRGKDDINSLFYRLYGTNSHNININSELVDMINVGGAHGGPPGYAIGSNSPSDSYDEDWRGRIIDVIIYNRALSNSEVAIVNAYEAMMSRKVVNSNLISGYSGSSNMYDLVGIGRESSTDYVLKTAYYSGSLCLESQIQTGWFLSNDNNYIIASHDGAPLTLDANMIRRKWFIQKTGSGTGKIKMFLNTTILKNINLYYSPNENFSDPKIITPTEVVSNTTITVLGSQILPGYYRFGNGPAVMSKSMFVPMSISKSIFLFNVLLLVSSVL